MLDPVDLYRTLNWKSCGFSSIKYVSTEASRNDGFCSTFSRKGMFVCK